MSTEQYQRTLFVYAKEGTVKCLSHDEALAFVNGGARTEGWTHTATLDPARWIESLCNGLGEDACRMMDELQFSKPVKP